MLMMTVEQPEEYEYESFAWKKIPVLDKKKIHKLKTKIEEYERDLYEPWNRSRSFDNADKKWAYNTYKNYCSELYRLQNKYGLIDEAKEYVKNKYKITPDIIRKTVTAPMEKRKPIPFEES